MTRTIQNLWVNANSERTCKPYWRVRLYPTVPNLVYSLIGRGRLSGEEAPWRRA